MTMTIGNQSPIRAHKGLGIASFVIALIATVLIVAVFAVAGANAAKMTPALSMAIGLGVLLACFIDLIGIGLGIAGAVDRTSKKVFPVLGLTVSVGILLLTVALIVIGLMLKAH